MGYKILLADDSVTVQKIITLTFSDEGADVLAVNNGDDAIHRLQYMRPALVMADVSIPGKNGYEICEFVKNHPDMKDTPVVLLVPAFEPFDEERARRIGADQHLTKPFQSIRTLITTVKNLIEANPPKFTTGSLNSTGSLAQAAESVKPPASVEKTEPEAKVEQVVTEPVAVEHQAVFGDAPTTQPFYQESPDEASLESVEENFSAATEEAEDVQMPGSPDDVQYVQMPDTLIDFEPEPLTKSEFDQITDAVTQTNVKALGEMQEIAPEPVITEESAAPSPVVQNQLNADADHVLDLDDVLTWPPTPTPEPRIESPQVLTPAAPGFTPSATETAIPQSVIDEIVNRVVAQLSEKLTVNLAAHLAPEVAELVKKQTQSEPAASLPIKQSDDSLLDLD